MFLGHWYQYFSDVTETFGLAHHISLRGWAIIIWCMKKCIRYLQMQNIPWPVRFWSPAGVYRGIAEVSCSLKAADRQPLAFHCVQSVIWLKWRIRFTYPWCKRISLLFCSRIFFFFSRGFRTSRFGIAGEIFFKMCKLEPNMLISWPSVWNCC